MNEGMSGDRIAGIMASIGMDVNGVSLSAPGTTDTFDAPTIDPMERYSTGAPERHTARGDEYVLFGYDDSDDYYRQNTRAVLKRIIDTQMLGAVSADIEPHTHHPPAFKYDAAIPVLFGPLNHAQDPDRTPRSITHAMCWVCMRPDDFLRAQASFEGYTTAEFVENTETARERGVGSITALERGLRSSEPVVPAPPMVLDTDGELEFQEGRTRAFIARELGVEWINVPLFVDKSKGSGSVSL